MDAGELNRRLELWGKAEDTNELGEVDFVDRKIRDLHASIIPQTGSLQRQAGIETILSNVTHKIIVRYLSGKDITNDMWFMYQGHRFDIKFILNPFFKNEKLEIFCEEVIG